MFTIPWPARFRQLPFLDPRHQGRNPPMTEKILAPQGSPMASWGPLGFEDFPQEFSVKPDRRTFIMPSAPFRAYPGLQLRNGVADLSYGFNTGATETPYYQQRPVQNPTLAQRYGGRAQQAPGALTSQDWYDRTRAGTAATGNGPGSIALGVRLRQRLGWSA